MPKPDEQIIGNTKPKRAHMKWENLPFRMQDRFETTEKVLPMPRKIKSPLEYFTSLFPQEIFDITVYQTNLYSTQVTQAKGRTAVTIMKDDIADFIVIEILMRVVDMPRYLDYWSNSLRHDKIASLMSLKKYQQIRHFIHFVNNDENCDRYFKIRHLLNIIRERWLQLDHEKAGSRRQYLPTKHKKKWRFKAFVRAGVSGIIYDFLPYESDDTFRNRLFTGEEDLFELGPKVVIGLCKTIPNPAASDVYFDNFFTTLPLVHCLRNEFGIFILGTIRTNKILRCDTLADNKSLKKWVDNKTVSLVCSYADAYPVSSVKRYCKDTREKIDVACLYVVKKYNTHIGSVYLADMLIALYGTICV
ncbi:hypothetical protein PR048_000418 [Dryococelus australis]|uniref:PiggyBac transposable element-derived protein domain-containing protein n=1 Tax=Dryococelus australis TaxID=614101 RepID=A0ABQ9IEJ0_9NEOP|nr:hypothetical protein PR048_000418 [Dryococelus australis]